VGGEGVRVSERHPHSHLHPHQSEFVSDDVIMIIEQINVTLTDHIMIIKDVQYDLYSKPIFVQQISLYGRATAAN
jgi:hypothetical protein